MFELFNNVFAERIESGRYCVFPANNSIKIFVNINGGMEPKKAARLFRNIARLIADIQSGVSDATNEGGCTR